MSSSREQFEVWAKKEKLGIAYGDCGYVFSSTEMAWRAWQTMEAKCAALAAEVQALKSAIPAAKGIDYDNDNMDDVSLAEDIGFNDAVNLISSRMKETPATDAFLAEVRAQGVEMVIAYHHERSDALAEVDRNGSFRHHSAAIDATDVLMKIRQDANTAELVAAGIINKVGE